LSAQASCGLDQPGLELTTPLAGFHLPDNASAGWETTAPAGITITHVYTINDLSNGVGDGGGWWGEFYWDGGRSNQITDSFDNFGCCQASFSSEHLGWFFACAYSNGCTSFADLHVGQVLLSATETQAPTIVALGNNLWYQSGWVRGVWPISFAASDPSGVCSTSAVLGSITLSGPGGSKNTDAWHQCPDQSWTVNVDTSTSRGSIGVGEGMMPFGLAATNAAGVSTGLSYAKTVNVDNQAPAVTISGVSDAPATAGTQYVTATGSAGPSGVSAVGCSLDGAPTKWSAGASAQVAVGGVGLHRVICYSANNARDAAGGVATSAPATWTLDIRRPTVSEIGFSSIVDKMRCDRVLERVRIPARWVTVDRHHRPVRVHERARTRIKPVTKCQMRTVLRRIAVWKVVVRHGRKVRVKRIETVRVPVAPHIVTKTTRRVRHGQGATVSGWLGLPDGTALPGQTVGVYTAPDNGLARFRLAAVVTTAGNGGWSAELKPGPSRLVEAVYGGGGTLEPATSAQVKLSVPAEILLRIRPRWVAWTGAITISGRLKGGYVPPDGVALRLRIRYPGGPVTLHALRSGPDGRFRFLWSFGSGNGSVRWPLWISTISTESDYPYAAASSADIFVTFGGHPPPS